MHEEKYDLYIPEDITSKSILDYGCGNGNLLNFGIDPNYYTGFEIDINAYQYCVTQYPEYYFMFQDIYSEVYNKDGLRTFPKLNQSYDIIFAYSVFTHTTYEYFLKCINLFKEHLNPNGSIYISMILFENDKMLRYFSHKRNISFGSCDKIIPTSTVGYLRDNKYNTDLEIYDNFVSIYDKEFLSQHGTIIETSMNQDMLKINHD